jgi:transposase-like protein
MKIADAKISGALAAPAANRMTRRTYPRQFKREVIAQCLQPGTSVSAIALSHGINANVIRKWLPQGDLRVAPGTAAMLPVTIEAAPAPVVKQRARPHLPWRVRQSNFIWRARPCACHQALTRRSCAASCKSWLGSDDRPAGGHACLVGRGHD